MSHQVTRVCQKLRIPNHHFTHPGICLMACTHICAISSRSHRLWSHESGTSYDSAHTVTANVCSSICVDCAQLNETISTKTSFYCSGLFPSLLCVCVSVHVFFGKEETTTLKQREKPSQWPSCHGNVCVLAEVETGFACWGQSESLTDKLRVGQRDKLGESYIKECFISCYNYVLTL